MRVRKPSRRAGVLAVILAALAGTANTAESYTRNCTIAADWDGDSGTVDCGGAWSVQTVKVRIAGWDAPEGGRRARCAREQAGHDHNRALMHRAFRGERVIIQLTGRRSFDREVVHMGMWINGQSFQDAFRDAGGLLQRWNYDGGAAKPEWC